MARKSRNTRKSGGTFLGKFGRSLKNTTRNALRYATNKTGKLIKTSGKIVGNATGKAGNVVGYTTNSASKFVKKIHKKNR